MPRISQSNPAKRWVLTINNYTKEEYEHVKQFFKINAHYAIIGKEIGDSGRPHLQIYACLKDKKRMSTLRYTLNPRAHYEKAAGTCLENKEFCSKSGDFIEIGTIPRYRIGSGRNLDRIATDLMVNSDSNSSLRVRRHTVREQHEANISAGFMDECVEIINKYLSFSQGKEAAPMTGIFEQSSACLEDAAKSLVEPGVQKPCDIEVNAKIKELEVELAQGNSQRDELTEKVQRLEEELAGQNRKLEEIAFEMMEKSEQIEACESEQFGKGTSQDLETINGMVANEANAAESWAKQKKQFEEDLAAKDTEIEHLKQELFSKTLALLEFRMDYLQTKLASKERSLGYTLTDKSERIIDLARKLEAMNVQVEECEKNLGVKDDAFRQLSSKAASEPVVVNSETNDG